MQNKNQFMSDMLLPSPGEIYAVELIGNAESKRDFPSYFDVYKYINTLSVIETFVGNTKDDYYWWVKKYKSNKLSAEFKLSDMSKLVEFHCFEEIENERIINTGDIILCEQKYGLYIGFDGLKEKHLCITTNSSVPDMFRDDTFNKDIQVKNFTVVSESGIEMLDEASYLIKHESQYYYKWILEWDAYNLKFPEKAVENLHKIITFDYRMYNKGKYWFM